MFESDLLQQNSQDNIFIKLCLLFTTEFANDSLYLSLIPFTLKGIKITPVKSYLNADLDKILIYKENNKKSGVYLWVNISNNNCYVGSSYNLSKRFTWYYSFNNLKRLLENSASLIGRALLKYGYSGFRLYILEYCEGDQLLNREQYYIDLLNPEYNQKRTAGSSLGNKHSLATIAKIKNHKFTSEQLANLKEHLSKHNASDEQRAKARVRMLKINEHKRMGTEVLDTVTGLTTTYSSIRQAADAIGCSHSSIVLARKAFANKGIEVLVKKRYKVKVTKIA